MLFDGFDLLDVIAPYEVFTAAAMYANEDITVQLVSPEGERMVPSGVNHLPIQASGKLDINSKGISYSRSIWFDLRGWTRFDPS